MNQNKNADSIMRDDEMEKKVNSIKKNTIKIDLEHLDSLLRYMHNQNKQLNKRVGALEANPKLARMAESIKTLEDQAIETKLSLKNIQVKIIDTEKKHLKFEDRIKTLEKDMHVTKQTERKLENKIKYEIKNVQKEIKTLENNFEKRLYKKCKPIEDKVMIALGSIDDIENEIEDLKSTLSGFQSKDLSPMKDDKDSKNISFAKKMTTQEKQKKATALSQVMDGEIKNLRKEMEEKFSLLDTKIKVGGGSSSFDRFLGLKDRDELFNSTNHNKRIEEAKGFGSTSFEKIDAKNYIMHNDMVLHQLYSRYKQIVEELDIYKDKIMANIKFGQKKTSVLVKNFKQRKRSNSLEFKVFKIKDDVLGKARFNFIKSPTPEKDLLKWNSNIDGRLEKIEKFCSQTIPNKFNESSRNGGLITQEIRVLESAINNLKFEINDLKNNTSKKDHEKTLFRAGTIEGEPISPNLKSTIEERVKNLKKNFDNEIDQYASDIKSFENQLAYFEKEMANKVDKSVIDNLEANLNNIIKQYIGSHSIANLMKELTDDILSIKDRIEFNFEKYDNRMEDFDKRITRYDEEYQKFLDEAEEIEKYKNKNKVLEIKIDKLFTLLQKHAFDLKSIDDEDIKDEINLEYDDQEKDGEASPKRRRSKMDVVTKKQIDAIHALYLKLETEIDDLKEKMKEREYATQMVEQSAIEIAQGKKPSNVVLKGARERDIHRIMNVEFMGMKQLIGKHQISLNRYEKNLRELQEFKNQNIYGKFDQEQRKMAEELRTLILKSESQYDNEITKLKGTIHSKTNAEKLETLQKEINEKVMSLITHKIDRDEHKRLQLRMNKKLNTLEKEVEDFCSKNNQDDNYKSPFVVTNNKCFSCNRVKEDSPEKIMPKTSNDFNKNKYIFKELYKKGPQMGASFSRLLSKLDKPETVSSMVRRKDVSNQIIEITPKNKDRLDKPKTGNSEYSKRKFESQNVLTPKVDFSSKSGTKYRITKNSSAPDISDGFRKNVSSKKDRTSVVVHKRNKTEKHGDSTYSRQGVKFTAPSKLKSGSSSRRDLKAYKNNL
ncbi:unnamed protein product [Moneuplotes crassus]|uniref:Uncharacterized protein n=1 Tax=Euplotes crassus TaxID=5936 RepID=A0AAD2CYT4_EUPCR|nr:unnamed protein product [Moneuplotes crassus]